MKNSLWLIIGLLFGWPSCPALAAPADGSSYVYVPPVRGAPVRRVGGGTRGPEDARAQVQVVAPPATAYSFRAQPRLFWYLSQPARVRIELTLMDESQAQPLVEQVMPAGLAAGFQEVDLAALGVQLQPGVDYQWSLALVSNDDERSLDVVSAGVVRYQPPPADLRLAAAPGERLQQLLSLGAWYDAWALLSDQRAAEPDQAQWRTLQGRLLDQVGLPVVAAAVNRR